MSRRGELLLHPVVIAALVVWAVNDHVGKEAWPGLVTGKLSDVAGVIVTPVLFLGVYELRPGGRLARPAVVAACVAAVGAAFVLVELVPAATEVYERGMGLVRWPVDLLRSARAGRGLAGPVRVQLWADAPDLLTLPFLAVPLVLGLRHARGAPGRRHDPDRRRRRQRSASASSMSPVAGTPSASA